jgi:hypothetical protein
MPIGLILQLLRFPLELPCRANQSCSIRFRRNGARKPPRPGCHLPLFLRFG